MKMQNSVIVLILVGLLSQPLVSFEQSRTNDDWAALKTLAAGTRVSVETKDGKMLKGDLGVVTETEISISIKGKAETIDISRVKSVHRYGGSTMGKTIAIGAAIGAGAGVGIGLGAVGATGGSDNVGAVIAPIVLAGAGVGALLGALVGKKKKILVYEAK